jgi:hypothetical protein
MYVYDPRLSGAQSAFKEQSTENLLRTNLAGDVMFGAAEVRKPSATNEQLPAWLQQGVQQGRWTKETASGLWMLRKISRG